MSKKIGDSFFEYAMSIKSNKIGMKRCKSDLIACGSNNGDILLYSIKGFRLFKILKTRCHVHAMLSINRNFLISGGHSGGVQIINTRNC